MSSELTATPTDNPAADNPAGEGLFDGWVRPDSAEHAAVEAMTRRYLRGLGFREESALRSAAALVADRCEGLRGLELRQKAARVLAETYLGRVAGPSASPELRVARRIDGRQLSAAPRSAANPMRHRRLRRAWWTRLRAAARQVRLAFAQGGQLTAGRG